MMNIYLSIILIFFSWAQVGSRNSCLVLRDVRSNTTLESTTTRLALFSGLVCSNSIQSIIGVTLNFSELVACLNLFYYLLEPGARLQEQ
jgi:hypothetical protein